MKFLLNKNKSSLKSEHCLQGKTVLNRIGGLSTALPFALEEDVAKEAMY